MPLPSHCPIDSEDVAAESTKARMKRRRMIRHQRVDTNLVEPSMWTWTSDILPIGSRSNNSIRIKSTREPQPTTVFDTRKLDVDKADVRIQALGYLPNVLRVHT
jgi:hypothetical protein